MPKIEIKEVDITGVGTLESTTTNAAYVPGYAIMGPVNEPIYCETLEQFKSIFGEVPYKFRTLQAGPSGYGAATWAQIGDYEKSYIYASELLAQGLPIWYERLFDSSTTNLNKWTASKAYNTNKMTIKSSTPGLVSGQIKIKLTSANIAIGGTSYAKYTLAVKREESVPLGTPGVDVKETSFTFSRTLSDQKGIPYYADLEDKTDATGLVTFTFGSITESTSLTTDSGFVSLTMTGTSSADEFTIANIYSTSTTPADGTLNKAFERLSDKGEYVMKYITSGAYPIFGYNGNLLTASALKIAANRGDVTFLLEPLPETKVDTLYSTVKSYVNSNVILNNFHEDAWQYGAMFTPWAKYNCTTIGKPMIMPGSFGYLLALAISIINNPDWYSVAGPIRGKLSPRLIGLTQKLTNAMAEEIQPRNDVGINPITEVKPYGYCIWGERTLKDNSVKGDLTATSFLNIRQLVNDIKRQVYVAAKYLTFEQDTGTLWVNFKSMVTPLLDKMVSGNGLLGYKIVRLASDKKATVKAKIILYSVYPVEDWDITISLEDSEVTIAG